MKQLLFTALSILLLSSYSMSQTTHDPKAKGILDQVSAKTKSYTAIKVNFTLMHQTKGEEGKGEKANGTLTLKGDKYVLSILGNTIYCDGKTIWTHMEEENEVVISSANTKGEAFDPAKMLTIYEKGFKYKFIQDRFEQGIATNIIDLYPEDIKNSEYSRVRLSIDKDKLQLWKIEYVAKDKNVYIISVNSFATNPTVADSDFVFSTAKHPKVEIIDER